MTDRAGLIASLRNANNAAEMARLRDENERLRGQIDAVREYLRRWYSEDDDWEQRIKLVALPSLLDAVVNPPVVS